MILVPYPSIIGIGAVILSIALRPTLLPYHSRTFIPLDTKETLDSHYANRDMNYHGAHQFNPIVLKPTQIKRIYPRSPLNRNPTSIPHVITPAHIQSSLPTCAPSAYLKCPHITQTSDMTPTCTHGIPPTTATLSTWVTTALTYPQLPPPPNNKQATLSSDTGVIEGSNYAVEVTNS